MKYLFVCAHPDDLEFGCANLVQYLTDKGQPVDVLCLTKGEFGIYDDAWIGPRLGELRVKELYRSTASIGVERKNIYFGDLIDGFVKFTRENVEYLRMWINRLQPDIIFAPEGYYAYYYQKDHINAGRLSYHVAAHNNDLLEHRVRALYYYNSAKPNFYWPFSDSTMGKAAFGQHRSQWWFIKWIMLFYPFEKFNYNKRVTGNWKYTEKYRRIPLHSPPEKPGLVTKSFIHAIANLKPFNPGKKRYRVPGSETNSHFAEEVDRLILKHYAE